MTEVQCTGAQVHLCTNSVPKCSDTSLTTFGLVLDFQKQPLGGGLFLFLSDHYISQWRSHIGE
jgi:hypothetical protein